MFWPNHPEFVRMAARFGATIVPFGVVGEDDLIEVSHPLLIILVNIVPIVCLRFSSLYCFWYIKYALTGGWSFMYNSFSLDHRLRCQAMLVSMIKIYRFARQLISRRLALTSNGQLKVETKRKED